jgi:hypothetical protein
MIELFAANNLVINLNKTTTQVITNNSPPGALSNGYKENYIDETVNTFSKMILDIQWLERII